jgi:hypothetical protein
LYSSRGWCDFWLFNVLLVAWGASIPVLFFGTFIWGRLREFKVTRIVGRKRRLRRANRKLAGQNNNNNRMDSMDNVHNNYNDMSFNGIDDGNGGVISGRATSSIVSINGMSAHGISPSTNGRRLLQQGNNNSSSVNNNNNMVMPYHATNNNNNNDDASARSGMDTPSASARHSGRPPDSISTDRRRHPHQSNHLLAAATAAANNTNNTNNNGGNGTVRWAETSDLSGRVSTTSAPLSAIGPPSTNTNNGGTPVNNNINNVIAQSGTDGTGSGRSRLRHGRFASDNLEVPALVGSGTPTNGSIGPPGSNRSSLIQRQSADSNTNGGNSSNGANNSPPSS